MALTVEQLYQQVLGRAPDAGGLAHWQATFGSSIDPNEVSMFRAAAAPELAAISQNKEAVSAPPPPPTGDIYAVGDPFTGGPFRQTTEQIDAARAFRETRNTDVQTLMNSGSMLGTANTTPTTVEQLYQQVLGRAPEAGAVNYWQQQFGNSIDPNEISMFLQAASPELAARGAPTQTAAQQAAAPLTVSSGSGSYGFQNGAPVLNNNQLKSILGGEMMASQSEDYGLIAGSATDGRYVPSSVADTLGWNLGSKYQGKILTGAAIHGVTDSVANATRLLNTLDQWNNLPADRKAEIGTIGNFFGDLASREEALTGRSVQISGDQEAEKAQEYSQALKNAAGTLKLDPNQSGANLLNAVNQAENRVVVTGRTNSWGQNASGADKEHAAVVYTPDASGRLVAASNVEKFDASDPKSKSTFQSIASGIATLASLPPITAALASFGAPFISQALTNAFGGALSDTAIQAISRGIINGAATGAITGDAEQALIGGLLSAGGSYALNSGALGNVMDRVGLGDIRTQFNIPNVSDINNFADAEFIAADATQLAGQGLGVQQIQDNLIMAGVDPALAASAANMAVTGASAASIAADLAPFGNQFVSGTPTGPGISSVGGAGTAGGMLSGTGAGAAGAGAGAAGAGAGAAGAGAAGTVANNVVNALTNPNTLSSLLGGAAGAAVDWALLNRYANEASQTGQNLANAATAAGQAAQVPFTPYTVTTGAGTSRVGPGSATATAAQPYQDIRTSAQQRALEALGAINPAGASQTMFNQMEALAAPSRERERLAMEERMAKQGLFGVGMNMPTVGGEIRTVNPLLESMLSAQATGRAQQALASTQFGTQEAQRLQQLSAGLQGQATGINDMEQGMLTTAGNIGNMQNQFNQTNAARQLQATLQGLQYRQSPEMLALQARLNAASGLGTAATNAAGGLLSRAINYIL